MQFRNNSDNYGLIAMSLHWVMAFLIIALIPLGWLMSDLPLGLEKFWYYNFHKSLGLIVLILAVMRLIWRWISPPPPPPHDQENYEIIAAHIVHIGLYVAFIAQPIIGIVHSWATGFPIVFFNSYTLPNLMAANKELAEVLTAAHFIVGWSIAALVTLHVSAAFKHHYIDKDNIFTRMLPLSKTRN